MPEFESKDLGSVFHVVVHFASDAHADEFFRLIDRPKKKILWWPEADGHQQSDAEVAYVAADSTGR